MKKIFGSIDTKSAILGGIVGFFLGLLIFSALVPSGLDMIRVYHLREYSNLHP